MGDLVYEPLRDGPTLWEIGIPDRTAAEFFAPDPNPNYVNQLYVNHPNRLAYFLTSVLQFTEYVRWRTKKNCIIL